MSGDGGGVEMRTTAIGGVGSSSDGGGGVKYGFTSPPGPRLFLQALCLHVCVPLGACDVMHDATNTIIRKRPRKDGGAESVMARLLELRVPGGVLLVFSLHRHGGRQCFVSVRGKKRRRLGKKGGREGGKKQGAREE